MNAERLSRTRFLTLSIAAIVVAALVSGAIAAPVMDLSRAYVDFGRLPTRTPSSIQAVFVTNTGDTPLAISTLSITGGNPEAFKAGGTCGPPITLAPNDRCRVELVMTPKGQFGRTESGQLTILSNASPAESDVLMTGIVDDANGPLGFDANPNWIDFGNQQVGVAAAPGTYTLTNPPDAKLTFLVTQFTLIGPNAGDFSVASPCTSRTPFPAGATCPATIGFTPSASGPRSAELLIEIEYKGFPGYFRYSVTGVGGGGTGSNYQGLWWAAPAGTESGWGINIAHQGETIFASWFTYDLTGKGLWLVMTAPKSGTGTYGGVLYATTGPPFNDVPFDPARVVATEAGSGKLTFTDTNSASFAYTVNGVSQTKAITRQVFGPLPTCDKASAGVAATTNYQDLWWKTPEGSESGWGINLNHEGDTIFAAWFTYDLDRTPLWLVVTAQKTAPGVYSGDLYRTTGPAFNAMPFDPNNVHSTKVGTATFTFADGNTATFAYTVQLVGMANAVTQSKAIAREIFAVPGTVCH